MLPKPDFHHHAHIKLLPATDAKKLIYYCSSGGWKSPAPPTPLDYLYTQGATEKRAEILSFIGKAFKQHQKQSF